jgi:mannose-1-phosphate guanylyltransferase/MurNAc alpha-1-phosphate uridylyltransferase
MADSLAASGGNRRAICADLAAGPDPAPSRQAAAGIVGVVLAAGAGARLAPLTDLRPKPLCPVGGVALLDRALDRVRDAVDATAVNLHHGAAEIADHLAARAAEGWAGPDHVVREEPEALGTAGALGGLRGWIDGRAVLVHNADVWGPSPEDVARFVDGWDGDRVRVLIRATSGHVSTASGRSDVPEFGPRVGLVATLLPWQEVARLAAEPSGLYETTLRAAWVERRLDAVDHRGAFVDCGTAADYLAANLAAADRAGGCVVAADAVIRGRVEHSVVGEGAVVDGEVSSCVLWPGTVVRADERLTGVIRAPGLEADLRPRPDAGRD